MKRAILILMLATVLFTLAACAQSTPTPSAPSFSQNETKNETNIPKTNPPPPTPPNFTRITQPETPDEAITNGDATPNNPFIIRPNKPGDETNIPNQSPGFGEHWDKLDEAIADGDATSLNTGQPKGWYRDLYQLDDTLATGNISAITVFARLKIWSDTGAAAKMVIKTGNVTYEGNTILPAKLYTDYSETWTTNPQTGSAWTWAEVNALQAGISLQSTDYGDFQGVALCTRLYIRITPSREKEVTVPLTITSSAFKEGEKIPIKYTCDGQDVSPPLAWSEPPASTRVFALIIDDPDAPGGVFTHWVLFNIPVSTRQLGEGISAQEILPDGAFQGQTDFAQIGYGGPCPPRGPTHRYRFTLYAMDRALDLKPGDSKNQVLDDMKGHILAWGQLTGSYQR